MHKTNGDQAQMLTDPVQSSGGLMLSVIPWKELGGAALSASVTACCKTRAEQYFYFLLFAFSPKSKNPPRISFSYQKPVLVRFFS